MQDSIIKAVLVGCGGISDCWLDAIKPFDDVQIVGLVDLDIGRARVAKQKHLLQQAQVGANLQEILRTQKPQVVFDCTIPATHATVTLTALNMGCHVLGEKPMADSMENARLMLQAAEANKRIYAVIQNRRYLDAIIRFRDLIHSQKVGNLTTLNADFYIGCHFGGFRDEMEHPLLLDMAIHSFDQARFISGEDPVSVYCHEWNPDGSWYHNAASAMAIFEMTNGVVFNYRGSWCAEGLRTSWECNWRAVGSLGSAIWDSNDHISAQKASGGDGLLRNLVDIMIPEKPPLQFTGHAGVIREFLDCVKNNQKPQTVCTDNIKSLAMVHAAIESAKTRKKVIIKTGGATNDSRFERGRHSNRYPGKCGDEICGIHPADYASWVRVIWFDILANHQGH